MKVTVIPFAINALENIPKRLIKGQEDLEIWQVTTNQSTALLRSAWILKGILETRGDLCYILTFDMPCSFVDYKTGYALVS